jgi:predicted nucleic acid-binding Zn ribbon protein
MTMPTYRTVCEKCGGITNTKLLSETNAVVTKTEHGSYIQLVLCPEHKAEWERLISDFLEGVVTDG